MRQQHQHQQPTEQEGVTTQDLIAKYGANRTITLEATGQTIGAGGENVTGDKAIILTFDDNDINAGWQCCITPSPRWME